MGSYWKCPHCGSLAKKDNPWLEEMIEQGGFASGLATCSCCQTQISRHEIYSGKYDAEVDETDILNKKNKAPCNTEMPHEEKDSRCFIATAAFSASSREVNILRRFRDRFLLPHPTGAGFVRWYYEKSPRWAKRIKKSPLKKTLVRILLKPLSLLAGMMLRD